MNVFTGFPIRHNSACRIGLGIGLGFGLGFGVGHDLLVFRSQVLKCSLYFIVCVFQAFMSACFSNCHNFFNVSATF